MVQVLYRNFIHRIRRTGYEIIASKPFFTFDQCRLVPPGGLVLLRDGYKLSNDLTRWRYLLFIRIDHIFIAYLHGLCVHPQTIFIQNVKFIVEEIFSEPNSFSYLLLTHGLHFLRVLTYTIDGYKGLLIN